MCDVINRQLLLKKRNKFFPLKVLLHNDKENKSIFLKSFDICLQTFTGQPPRGRKGHRRPEFFNDGGNGGNEQQHTFVGTGTCNGDSLAQACDRELRKYLIGSSGKDKKTCNKFSIFFPQIFVS